MLHHRTLFSVINVIASRGLTVALALSLFGLAGASHDQSALAKAPPLATMVVNGAVYAAPDIMDLPIGTIAADTQVELTGEAAPGFLAVYYGETVAWVPAQFLSISDRPGIDTAVTLIDTPLLEAPIRDAGVVVTIPQDSTVILTGASVNGYDAASHDGSGGWINDRHIAR